MEVKIPAKLSLYEAHVLTPLPFHHLNPHLFCEGHDPRIRVRLELLSLLCCFVLHQFWYSSLPSGIAKNYKGLANLISLTVVEYGVLMRVSPLVSELEQGLAVGSYK